MLKHPFARIAVVGVALLALGGTSFAAYGYVWGFDGPRALAPTSSTGPATTSTSTPSTTTSTTLAPTTTRPTTTTTHPGMPDPPVVAMPAVGGGLGSGSRSDAVKTYESRLAAMHFDPGPIDGYFDQSLRYAVEAVQKTMGLPRTGRIDEATRFAIGIFRYPKPHSAEANTEGDRVEIDLDRQILVVWTGWKIRLITTTSTGSGRHFCGGDSGCQYAVTPAGHFHFTRHVVGWRTSKLGKLWSPYYFNGGIAVHGYSSVPTQPASHGCARIPMFIADYFATLVHKDESVWVYGTPAHDGIAVDPNNTTRPATHSSTTRATTPTTAHASTTTAPRVTTSVRPATTTTHHTTPTT